jgi:hypothetical protein
MGSQKFEQKTCPKLAFFKPDPGQVAFNCVDDCPFLGAKYLMLKI